MKEWSPEFVRAMVASGTLTPPLKGERRMPRWYWPLCIVVTLVAMGVAFWWGVYGP